MLPTYMAGAFCAHPTKRIKCDSFLFLLWMIDWDFDLLVSRSIVRNRRWKSNKSEHHGYSRVIYTLQISPCMALGRTQQRIFSNRVSPPPCLLTLNVVLTTATTTTAATTLTAPTILLIDFFFSRSSLLFWIVYIYVVEWKSGRMWTSIGEFVISFHISSPARVSNHWFLDK